jgi:hypothetical protein
MAQNWAAYGQQPGACGYYTNSAGHMVPRPCGDWHSQATPPGATAWCTDGTYSYCEHPRASGTCSHHGGVVQYLSVVEPRRLTAITLPQVSTSFKRRRRPAPAAACPLLGELERDHRRHGVVLVCLLRAAVDRDPAVLPCVVADAGEELEQALAV